VAIALQAAGTLAAGTTSVTPTNPSHAADDLLICVVHAKPTLTATPPIFGTPTGWTPLVSGNDGSGTAQGTDAGQVWTASFYKLAASGAEANPVCSVTNGNVCMASVNSWRKTNPGAWSVQGVIAGDTTSATSWSTAHAAMGLAPGDGLDYRCGASGNGTNSNIFPANASGLTATGHTFFAGTSVAAANTNNGNDMAAGGYNFLVATGTSASVTLTLTATLLAAQKGCAVFVRLREPAAVSAVMAAPLGALTATMAGTVQSPVVAVLDAPLGSLTSTATAVVSHPAVLDAPLGSLTAAIGTVTVEHPAVLAAPLGALTAAAAADVTHTAVMAAPLGALTAAAAAVVETSAVLTAPLGALTATATGDVTVHAVLDAPLGALTAQLTAVVEHPAVMSAALGSLTAAAAAVVDTAAVLDAQLGALTSTGTATVATPAVLSASLGALTATAAATVTSGSSTIGAVLNAPLGALTSGAVADVEHSAVLTATLGALVSAAAAGVAVPAVLVAQLGVLTATMGATVTSGTIYPDPYPVTITYRENGALVFDSGDGTLHGVEHGTLTVRDRSTLAVRAQTGSITYREGR
jgi:hypothetical protein